MQLKLILHYYKKHQSDQISNCLFLFLICTFKILVMFSFKILAELLCFVVMVTTESFYNNRNNTSRSISKIYSTCGQSNNLVKCIKLQALKLADRANNVPQFKLLDGVEIVKKDEGELDKFADSQLYSDNLPTDEINSMLINKAGKFFSNHEVQINIPRLLTVGVEKGRELLEGRGKKYKKYLGPFVAALAIKGGILTMVYHSIAIIAGKAFKNIYVFYFNVANNNIHHVSCIILGKALIIGKIALVRLTIQNTCLLEL